MSNLFAFADAAIALPLRAQIRRILKARTADRATEQQSNRATGTKIVYSSRQRHYAQELTLIGYRAPVLSSCLCHRHLGLNNPQYERESLPQILFAALDLVQRKTL